jgi:hypothetical protein
MNSKTCPTCEVAYPATHEFFYRNGERLRSLCKRCYAKTRKRSYLQREQAKLAQMRYYRTHLEYYRDYARLYRRDHMQEFRDYQRRYRARRRAG